MELMERCKKWLRRGPKPSPRCGHTALLIGESWNPSGPGYSLGSRRAMVKSVGLYFPYLNCWLICWHWLTLICVSFLKIFNEHILGDGIHIPIMFEFQLWDGLSYTIRHVLTNSCFCSIGLCIQVEGLRLPRSFNPWFLSTNDFSDSRELLRC